MKNKTHDLNEREKSRMNYLAMIIVGNCDEEFYIRLRKSIHGAAVS